MEGTFVGSMPRVAVVGGSLGGLTAALLLKDLGCEVSVYERSHHELEARGAGIAVLEATWRYPVQRLGVPADEFSSKTRYVRFLESDGSITYQEPRAYHLSSWNAVYRVLLHGFGRERYHLSSEMTTFVDDGEHVTVNFADGRTEVVDLLVCADGITSEARQTLLPGVASDYAGYVAWRGVIPESELSAETFDALHESLTYQVMENSHILVYPIPGLAGEVEPGHRLMNIVWYCNVAPDDLEEFLTDVNGEVRTVSVPPGLVNERDIEQMRSRARLLLAPPLAEVVTGIEEPFLQVVYDIEVPRMAFGRVCLIGDAAFACRPHAAAGTAKAAEDGWILAEEMDAANGDVVAALAAWEVRQLALGRSLLARTRDIGARSQFEGTFKAGDPELVFGLYGPGN
jgi:2,6-dihydroxypyridine 3-monooxygenase